MNRRTWTDDQLREAVASSMSLAQVIRKLNLAIAGGTYDHIKNHIKKLDLDTTHFTGRSGKYRYGKTKKLLLEDILVEGSPYTSSEIRKVLFSRDLIENKCSLCGITEWMGNKIICQLHHINGVGNDNRLENLTMLCPNCHVQTDSWGRKSSIKLKFDESIKTRCYEVLPAQRKKISKSKENHPSFLICQQCNHAFSYERDRIYCSTYCYHINTKGLPKLTKIEWPTDEELARMVWETPRSRLASQLGISDKAIAKRCDKLGVEQPSRGYWAKKKADTLSGASTNSAIPG